MTPPPRIIGLLSWYDEIPAMLDRAIRSAHKHLGLDHLVALDGAYSLFPAAPTTSAPDQRCAIQSACRAIDLPVTIYQPALKFAGNEVHKRSLLFALGDVIAEDGTDWYYVIDADEIVLAGPSAGLGALLDDWAGDFEAAEVQLHDTDPSNDQVGIVPIRKLFRAAHGIEVRDVHWHYHHPDGYRLWGPNHVDALDLTDTIVVEHRNWERTAARDAARRDYYRARDASGTELIDCQWCGAPKAGRLAMPRYLGPGTMAEQAEAAKLGVAAFRAEQIAVCGDCAPKAAARFEYELAQQGLDAAGARAAHLVS